MANPLVYQFMQQVLDQENGKLIHLNLTSGRHFTSVEFVRRPQSARQATLAHLSASVRFTPVGEAKAQYQVTVRFRGRSVDRPDSDQLSLKTTTEYSKCVARQLPEQMDSFAAEIRQFLATGAVPE
jgi:hypothetical protein